MISVEGVSPFSFLPQWIALVFHTQLCFFSYSLVLIFFIEKWNPALSQCGEDLKQISCHLPSSVCHHVTETELSYLATWFCIMVVQGNALWEILKLYVIYNMVMPRLLQENVCSFYLLCFWRRKWYWLRWDDI